MMKWRNMKAAGVMAAFLFCVYFLCLLRSNRNDKLRRRTWIKE